MVIIYLLLGYLLTDACVLCSHAMNCSADIRSDTIRPKEGDNVNLTCYYNNNETDVMIKWTKNDEVMEGQNKTSLILIDVTVHNEGQYICSVNSSDYSCVSLPYKLSVESNLVIILVICGISALALILIMGLAMKYKMKRDNDKHKERMKQRTQAGQAGGPFPYAPRES